MTLMDYLVGCLVEVLRDNPGYPVEVSSKSKINRIDILRIDGVYDFVNLEQMEAITDGCLTKIGYNRDKINSRLGERVCYSWYLKDDSVVSIGLFLGLHSDLSELVGREANPHVLVVNRTMREYHSFCKHLEKLEKLKAGR